MNLRKLILPILSLSLVVLSCKDDEEMFQTIPDRDRQEVYDEDILEIEEYLATHFFNYEEFEAADPYSLANDSYTVVFDTIAGANSTKTPIIDFLDATTFPKLMTKTVNQDDIDYNLYYLVVREGLGNPVNALDKAAMLYNGMVPDGTVFDSAISVNNGQPFTLTGVGNVGGVVPGFREGIIEFNTATNYTENSDGTLSYNNHGIGAVFMPSGLGYFSASPSSLIPNYSPLFFTISVISRSNTDYDQDGIPSHIEHPDGNFEEDDDDTDGDMIVNFIDNDDDEDGVLTRDEVIKNEYLSDDTMTPFMTREEAQNYFDTNITDPEEIFVSIEFQNDGTYVLNTVTILDHNDDGIPNYLDASYSVPVE